MRAMMSAVVFVALLVTIGCGGDDGSTPTADSGPVRVDSGVRDAGTPNSYAIRLRLIDQDGMPVQGAFIAADTSVGRFEARSDVSGNVDLDLQAWPRDTHDLTVAKERFVIRTWARVPVGEITADRRDVILSPVEVPLAERTMVTINVVRMPTGGRFCASFDGWHLCGMPGFSSYGFQVPTAMLGEDVHIFVMNDTDAVVDFIRAPIPATGTTRVVGVSADDTLDAPIALDRDMTINLPAGDAMSPLLTATLPDQWGWWFGATEDRDDGQFVGVATRLRRDRNVLRIHYTSFDTGEPSLRWGTAVWTQLADFHSVTFTQSAADPGPTVDVLGFARLSAGRGLMDTFSWTVPRTGVTTALDFRNNAQAVFWTVESRETSNVRIPAVPAGYDRSISFPFSRANGDVVLRSFIPGPTLTAPPAAISFSPPFPMTY